MKIDCKDRGKYSKNDLKFEIRLIRNSTIRKFDWFENSRFDWFDDSKIDWFYDSNHWIPHLSSCNRRTLVGGNRRRALYLSSLQGITSIKLHNIVRFEIWRFDWFENWFEIRRVLFSCLILIAQIIINFRVVESIELIFEYRIFESVE